MPTLAWSAVFFGFFAILVATIYRSGHPVKRILVIMVSATTILIGIASLNLGINLVLGVIFAVVGFIAAFSALLGIPRPKDYLIGPIDRFTLGIFGLLSLYISLFLLGLLPIIK